MSKRKFKTDITHLVFQPAPLIETREDIVGASSGNFVEDLIFTVRTDIPREIANLIAQFVGPSFDSPEEDEPETDQKPELSDEKKKIYQKKFGVSDDTEDFEFYGQDEPEDYTFEPYDPLSDYYEPD